MMIYGLSQTTGVERTLTVDASSAGVRLQSRDSDRDLDAIVVPTDALMSALIDQPADRTTLDAVTADGQPAGQLDITVRRNEVMLWARTPAGDAWDIAVGFDDFQDALEQASDAA